MKGKQLMFDSALADLARYQLEREKREVSDMIRRLDENYQRVTSNELQKGNFPVGTVVIIGQELFRDGHYKRHFYRSILNYHQAVGGRMTDLFAAPNDEWPDVMPWAGVVNRPDYHKYINPECTMMYWTRHEVVEPIELN